MKVYLPAVLAVMATGVAAQNMARMPRPTAPAVLRKRAPDTCLDAISASNFCSCVRLGKEDCSSFFVVTLQDTTQTVLTTTITSTTSYTTGSETSTTTVLVTFTTTTDVTSTTSTSTTATSAIPTAVARKRGNMIKRYTATPTMPYYARQACTDVAQYESACSVLGVESSTIYRATVVTTDVVETSTIAPIITETTTASTEFTTKTVTTETSTTTVSTQTAVATITVNGPFWIQIASQSATDSSGNSVTGDYVERGFFDDSQDTNPMTFFLPSNDPLDERAQFVIDSDGYLKPISETRGNGIDLFVSYDNTNAGTQAEALNYGSTSTFADGAGQTRLKVSFANVGGINRMSIDSSTGFEFQSCLSKGAVAVAGTVDPGGDCVGVELAAVPVDFNCAVACGGT